jgi:3,4-dihydroxy 2-butanone 4-phosphate synthase/GTP cyclohydrolase II
MKVNAMRDYGIEVAAVERLRMVPGQHNAGYLRTKRDRMGHDLTLDEHDKGASA